MKTLILSTLLHYANRDIPHLGRKEFYAIKKEILKKHGRVIDTQYQHIKKECYSCDGTGIFYPEFRPKEPCWKCRNGVYEEFVAYLALYQFGKYTFHIPYHKVYIYKDGDLPKVDFIKGYIHHKAPNYGIGRESALLLLLFYDFKTFKRVIRSSQLYRPRTPLVIIQWVIFFFRHKQYQRWFPKKTNQVEPYNYSEDELPF